MIRTNNFLIKNRNDVRTPKTLLLAKIFFSLWLLLLLFQFHGFSMGAWNTTFPEAGFPEPLIGKARGIRSDDWMAQLPAMISQSLNDPAFAEVNTLIHPDGQEMRLGMNVPVKSWIAIFKPTTWGYFISPDFGLSWHWQLRVFLLLGSAYAFFLMVMGASPGLSAWGALCLAGSSFFAYWSYISEPIIGLGLLISVLLFRQLRSPQCKVKAWEAPLMYWAMVAFCVNNLYPPFQVPMIYFALMVAVYSFCSDTWQWRKFITVSAILFLAVLTVGFHFYENQETLIKLLGTVYPGLRVSSGGHVGVGGMFMMTFLAINGYGSFPGINISEAGTSFLVGLLGPFAFLLSSKKVPPNDRILAWALFSLTVWLGIYCFIGIPEMLAKLSGWSRVPSFRTMGLWALLNICWLVWWFKSNIQILDQKKNLLIGGVVFVAFALLASSAQAKFSFLNWGKLLPGLLLLSVVAVLLARQSKWAKPLFLAIILIGAYFFNPIDRKSHSKIVSSASVQKLKQEFQASGKKTLLVLDANPVTAGASANFLRMIGISSYGGMHFIPQLKFWQELSSNPADARYYNRFAHVIFTRAATGQPTHFENPAPDVLKVFLSEEAILKISTEALVKENLW